MEPVVAHPAVDHRAHRRCDFERRVRMHERHDYGEALVRASEHAHAPVRLGDVLHEPVDGVVGVGRMVDVRGIQRTLERPGHDVVALGAVLAADVLEDADVAVGDEDLIALRQRCQHTRRARPRCARRGVVRRARQEHRRTLGGLGNDDDGVELDAVAHRNHLDALDVVVAFAGSRKGFRDVRGDGRCLCERRRGEAYEERGQERAPLCG